MQAILRDIRYGIRSLTKSPGLAFVATLALTLGIGLTATMYSILYGALMKGLPYQDGERIVQMVRNNPTNGSNRMGTPIGDFVDYRDQQQTMSTLAAYYGGTVNVSGIGEAERFSGRSSPRRHSNSRECVRTSAAPSRRARIHPAVLAWSSSDTVCGSVALAATRPSSALPCARMECRTPSSA
jgi:hypothetical protein